MNENTKQMEQILDTLTNRRLSLASMLGDTLEGVMEDVEDALRTVRGTLGTGSSALGWTWPRSQRWRWSSTPSPTRSP